MLSVQRRHYLSLVAGGMVGLAGCNSGSGETDQQTTTQATTSSPTTEINTQTDQTTTSGTTTGDSEYSFTQNEDGWYMTPSGDCRPCNTRIISDPDKYKQIRSNIEDWKGEEVFIENVTLGHSKFDGWWVLNEFGGSHGYFAKGFDTEPEESIGLLAEIQGTKTIEQANDEITGITVNSIQVTGAIPDSKDTPTE